MSKDQVTQKWNQTQLQNNHWTGAGNKNGQCMYNKLQPTFFFLYIFQIRQLELGHNLQDRATGVRNRYNYVQVQKTKS